MKPVILFFFFFSSRRRHTRCSRDWSFRRVLFRSAWLRSHASSIGSCGRRCAANQLACSGRSEERRVGKECRSRGSPYHEKKKKKRRRGWWGGEEGGGSAGWGGGREGVG